MARKIIKWFFAVMFLSFAALQYNDPDPLVWMLVYGSMMVTSVMAAFDKYPSKAMIAMAGGFLILSLLYVEGMVTWLNSPNRNELFDNLAKMEHLYIEEAREFLGLVICIAVLLFYFYEERKQTAQRE